MATSEADFRVEHDKCFLWISEIYFDLAGCWSCGVNGTVGGYWLLERASGYPYLWDDMTHDEWAAGRDEHIRRPSEKFGEFDVLESDTR